MKKIWKILGAAALVAGLVPYKAEHDIETDEKTYQALLWKVTTRPSAELDDKRQVTVNLGFHKPHDPEANLFEDDSCWCCSTPVEESFDSDESISF